VFLLATIVSNGWNSFRSTEVQLPIAFDRAVIGQDLRRGDYQALVQRGLAERGIAAPVISDGAWLRLRAMVEEDPSILGTRRNVWLTATSNLDQLQKGGFNLDAAEADRAVTNREVAAWRALAAAGDIRIGWNRHFTGGADSIDPELAGVWGAFLGSLLTLVVTLAIAFPVGVLSGVYLEEFAPKNRWTDLIEVSINNLAAVPSIIFGLLGLAVFLNTLDMPRSAPLVGGLTLALMTLPVIVIAGRAAIKAVPPSIRDAALGVGASRVQVVFHHVLPLALPGIMTGTIIGMARALGETAPLLMIGMRAFLTDTPGGLAEPATALPVQVFLWSDQVARGFVEKTSGAIIVLLVFLLMMNSLAIYLRNRFEVRW
jgi:phosphate transport system permease protein